MLNIISYLGKLLVWPHEVVSVDSWSPGTEVV